jgi:hypothetical protein
MSTYEASAGTRVFVGDLGSDPSQQIEGVKEYSEPPKRTKETIDRTRVDKMRDDDPTQPEMLIKKAPGFRDPGTTKILFGWDEDEILAIYDLDDGVERSWKYLFASGAKATFDGFVLGIENTFDSRGEKALALEIQLTTEVEYAGAP